MCNLIKVCLPTFLCFYFKCSNMFLIRAERVCSKHTYGLAGYSSARDFFIFFKNRLKWKDTNSCRFIYPTPVSSRLSYSNSCCKVHRLFDIICQWHQNFVKFDTVTALSTQIRSQP